MLRRTKQNGQDGGLTVEAYTVVVTSPLSNFPPASYITIPLPSTAPILRLRLVIASGEHLQLRLPDLVVL